VLIRPVRSLMTSVCAVCATVFLAAPTAGDSQGSIVVVPVDPGSVLGPPSVDLGAAHPAQDHPPPGDQPRPDRAVPPGGQSAPPGRGGGAASTGTPVPTPGSAANVPPGFIRSNTCFDPTQLACVLPSAAGNPPATGAPPAPAAPTADVLAQQAEAQLVLPLPTPRHSPDLRLPDGRLATVVGERTWFWTDPATWQPHSQRVQAGGVWAEATATPVALTMDPGNGQTPATCTGPGTPYSRDFAVHAASPSGCDVVYQRSSANLPGQQVSATWSITWQVTWQGNTGTAGVGGTLPALVSRSVATFVVADVESVRIH
jgi:hypothetical protein